MSAKGKARGAHRQRPTIGLLLGRLAEPYQAQVWPGLADLAREKGVGLICFPGRSPNAPYSYDIYRNVVFDLVGPENVDGLVLLSGTLGNYLNADETAAFCRRFSPLPMVSVAIELDGIPSVLVDNYTGARQAVDHLIDHHGLTRIAVIRGPEGHQEADERFRAYADSLAEHGIPLDPQLVAPGDFVELKGSEAVRILLDERDTEPEAIVCANDDMALGALRALRRRGIRVPNDLALVGFDDLEISALVRPPLTTVRQPLYEQGRRAGELLLALLDGQSPPERVLLETQLITRQSCGCLPDAAVRASALGEGAARMAAQGTLADHRADIIAAASEGLGEGLAGRYTQLIEDVVKGFESDLEGSSSGRFLAALSAALEKASTEGKNARAWQDALSELRRSALPFVAQETCRSAAENLWHQARVLVCEAAQNAHAFARLQAHRQALDVIEGSHVLMTTFDMPQLLDAAAEQLPRLGATAVFLSLYDGDQVPSEESRLILAYDENGRRDLGPDGQRFPSRQLAPQGMLSGHRQRTLFVEPLHFRDEQLGFALVEMSHEHMLYETLWRQVSTALKGALLRHEREEAQRETCSLMEFNRSIVQTIAEGIAVQDAEGRFSFVNPAFASALGYESEELVGRHWTTIAPPDQQAIVEEALERRRAGEADRYEIDLLCRDGSRAPFMVSATPRTEQGEFAGTLAAFTDISGRKKVEQTLAQQKEELARSNAELEQFVFVASHHLQEPLRAIAGQARLLQRYGRDGLSEEPNECIDSIAAGAVRMRQLINDLLDYSRVATAGKPFRETSCSRLLNQALAVLWPMIQECGAAVTYDALPTVHGDPRQLNRVFHELVLNAMKFRDEKPPRIHVGCERHDGEWKFYVEDNGPGIEPQYLERIFKLFQTLDVGEDQQGTGIGLALCRKIIERHGGRIWAESEPGEGSVFYFTIPTRSEKNHEQPEDTAGHHPSGGG
jgi:PAS domain S-box-containing protein